jgi:thymidylate synthase (FAD)
MAETKTELKDDIELPFTAGTSVPSNKTYMSDGIGFIELLDVFGDDLTVVNAARVSLHKESHDLCERDEGLIKYLAKHNHLSPFFHPQLRFRIKMPIFVVREWYRHTVGFARNEVSRRYVYSEPECWTPTASGLRQRAANVKQGSSSDEVENSEVWELRIQQETQHMIELYNQLLDAKVAPELARTVLPQSMYTEFIETASLYGYLRLLKLRMSPDAQMEIHHYADAIGRFLYNHFPKCHNAFF